MILVKTLLAPGTLPFAILVGGVAALLMRRPGNRRRLGGALVALLLISYFALSLPPVADRLSAPLIQFGRLPERDGENVSAIVVLDGDSQHARVLETLRLSQILANRPIIVSGPLELREKLVDAG